MNQLNKSSQVEWRSCHRSAMKRKTNKLADHFITCKTCFQSEQTLCKDVLISCRWETDEKEICKWSSCEDCRVYKSARAFISLIHFFASMGPSAVLSKNSYSYIQFNNNKNCWKMTTLSFYCIHCHRSFPKVHHKSSSNVCLSCR